MTGCGAPSNTGAGGPCWALLRLKKKNVIRAAAESATSPPAIPPEIARTLEEEPPVLGVEDELAVPIVWEDVTTEAVDDDDDVPGLIISPPSTSGRSETGSLQIESDGVMEIGGIPTTNC
jgi:hypothetical protein